LRCHELPRVQVVLSYAPPRMEPAGRQSLPPAEAGAFLLGVVVAVTALGALLGWLAGSVGIGILIGAVIGIPGGTFAVYRRYRGAF
jgi:F0F1-type ATP synthase assembly protein I